jgi:hypothetical protein
VTKFPVFEYGMRQVRRAGQIIADELIWNPESEDRIRDAFSIANNWRESHAYPMRSVHLSLKYYVRAIDMSGFTSARLKRMQAIRRKLRREDFSIELNQLQDLGGCRVIMNDIAGVRLLVRMFTDRTKHDLRKPDDYITKPKADGYRSYHVILSYKGRGDAAVYDKRRIEIQVRTRLQHAWATAVEGVGVSLAQDLKGGHGDPDWLRLFRLVSAEFAMLEGCAEGDVPGHLDRTRELIELDKKLNALEYLENIGSVVKYVNLYHGESAPYYLVSYDVSASTVEVEPYYIPTAAVYGYENLEKFDNLRGTESRNVVLVEADKIDNLMKAFPNYFGDVTIFKETLSELITGKIPKRYRIKPPEIALPPPEEKIDVGWLRRSRFSRPKGA